MNIFFLAWDPDECAKLYCDQHVNKILLEIVQMLYTAWHLNMGGVPRDAPLRQGTDQHGYKPVSNVRHPMVMWVRSNYSWTCALGMALAIEFRKRFRKVHGCTPHILWLRDNVPTLTEPPLVSKTATYSTHGFPDKMSPVPLCMPDEYKHPHVLIAYYQYYMGDKLRFARWAHNT